MKPMKIVSLGSSSSGCVTEERVKDGSARAGAGAGEASSGSDTDSGIETSRRKNSKTTSSSSTPSTSSPPKANKNSNIPNVNDYASRQEVLFTQQLNILNKYDSILQQRISSNHNDSISNETNVVESLPSERAIFILVLI